jgi:hypothetical protein
MRSTRKPASADDPASANNKDQPRIFMVPCSCGTTFGVSQNYDRGDSRLSRYLTCPNCGKRHDPRNRLLEIGYQARGFWAVDKC